MSWYRQITVGSLLRPYTPSHLENQPFIQRHDPSTTRVEGPPLTRLRHVLLECESGVWCTETNPTRTKHRKYCFGVSSFYESHSRHSTRVFNSLNSHTTLRGLHINQTVFTGGCKHWLQTSFLSENPLKRKLNTLVHDCGPSLTTLSQFKSCRLTTVS